MTNVRSLAPFSLAVLLGCAKGDDDCVPHDAKARPRANLVLSTPAIDFGTLARGSRAEATVYVEHTGVDPDTGEAVAHDIGIGRLGEFHEAPLGIVASSPAGFTVAWSLDEAECPAGAAMSVQWLLSGDSGWVPPSREPPDPPGGEIVRIGPGCKLPLHIAFNATWGGVHAAALLVETVHAPGIDGGAPAVYAKPERVQQLYLSASVIGPSTGQDPILVGGVEASPDECHPGDQIELSLRAYDPDGSDLMYVWGDDRDGFASFDDPFSATPRVDLPRAGTRDRSQLHHLRDGDRRRWPPGVGLRHRHRAGRARHLRRRIHDSDGATRAAGRRRVLTGGTRRRWRGGGRRRGAG